MPQVDFYILQNDRHPEHLVCQLTLKALQQGLKVQIRTADEAMAQAIDHRLWTFSDTSFVPHALYRDAEPPDAPVLITWQEATAAHSDVLMNLGREIPEHSERFARIIEIVASAEDTRQAARGRYREYRDRGYTLETHEIN